MAGIYGYPKGQTNLPGLLQVHGGGQYAHSNAVLTNAKRGYATLSIAWAGRISAPGYQVTPKEVKLFWEGKTDDPKYKLTTDWGALDAYHAPSRYGQDAFPSIPVAEWTLDPVKSPRNNSWFLITIAGCRGLTFLEKQPEVDASKLGVYGHSMGGKLTVLISAADKRVKAAAPSCGGISDRYSEDMMHLATVSDPPSLKRITCPIIFLSPSNDFHGRINDLEQAVREIQSTQWRVSCSPHHNHQDSPEYEVATQVWFDHHLKGGLELPDTPDAQLILQKESCLSLMLKQMGRGKLWKWRYTLLSRELSRNLAERMIHPIPNTAIGNTVSPKKEVIQILGVQSYLFSPRKGHCGYLPMCITEWKNQLPEPVTIMESTKLILSSYLL